MTSYDYYVVYRHRSGIKKVNFLEGISSTFGVNQASELLDPPLRRCPSMTRSRRRPPRRPGHLWGLWLGTMSFGEGGEMMMSWRVEC